jgi:hypothetical protein
MGALMEIKSHLSYILKNAYDCQKAELGVQNNGINEPKHTAR